MDSEASIQPSGERLMEMRLSLSEILGPNWKEHSIFPSIEAALEGEGAKTLRDGEEVLPPEAQTDLDRFIVEANTIFRQNESPYCARRIVDSEGRPKVLIVGRVGEDTFYQTARYTQILDSERGRRVVSWRADTMGLVGKSGKVLRLDRVLQAGRDPHREEENDILFFEIAGKKYQGNASVALSRFQNGMIILLPKNYQEMGIFLHELGHLLRNWAILRDPQLYEASLMAHREYEQTSETGSPVNPKSRLTPYQTRKIKADNERGAWALGISLIREAGKKSG